MRLPNIIDLSVINKQLHKGFYITLFSVIQFGFLMLQPEGAESLDFSISIWRFGFHFHFTLAQENRCLAILRAKRR
jgi:hypothetical protein